HSRGVDHRRAFPGGELPRQQGFRPIHLFQQTGSVVRLYGPSSNLNKEILELEFGSSDHEVLVLDQPIRKSYGRDNLKPGRIPYVEVSLEIPELQLQPRIARFERLADESGQLSEYRRIDLLKDIRNVPVVVALGQS